MDPYGMVRRLAELVSRPQAGPDPGSRHRATDASGAVQVVLDGRGRCAELVVGPSWRVMPAIDGLGPAAVDALAAASMARLAASVSTPVPGNGAGQAITLPPVTRRTADRLARAWPDLAEFASRLGEMHAAETVVRSEHVTVTTLGGRIVRIDPDRRWLAGASRTEIGAHLASAVNAGLDALAAVPEQALAGCPDLHELLANPPHTTRIRQEP